MPSHTEFSLFRNDPEGYAGEVLGVEWWGKQGEIARAVLRHQRTMVLASHAVGKTFLAGGLVNWHYDCWDPGLTLTTAPTARQVQDLLWKEVRVQRAGRPGLMRRSPRMESSPDHFAHGFTTTGSDAFQGRHEERVFIAFDEATGVHGSFWDGAEAMLTGDDCRWLAILNPTDTTSRAYQEFRSGAWHVIRISALDHPNIQAELTSEKTPYPKAVRLSWVEDKVRRWCTPISAGDRDAHDIEWPPGSGDWHRPGPMFEGRVLGRWPRLGSDSVWSEAQWEACLAQKPVPQEPLRIGCDVARYGDDWTVMHARRGGCSLWHERHNGWSTGQTAARLKELARELAERGENPQTIEIRVDDDGVGGGVVDQAHGWRFVPISAAARAIDPEGYPNARSEMWFAAAGRASSGGLDLSRLDSEVQEELRTQLLAPKWRLDSMGRRKVEPKDEIKKRLGGRSTDDADAFNLCHYTGGAVRLDWIDL